MFDRRGGLIVVAVVLGWTCLTSASAIGAAGGLTFKGCIGEDREARCTQTSPTYLLDGADSVAISADGNSVYAAANTGSEGGVLTGLVDEFSRNSSTGALTLAGCIGDGAGSPCTGTEPSDALGEPESVAVSPDGKSVYATSAYASDVARFSRNTSTGILTYDGCVGDNPGCTSTSPANALGGADSVAVSADGTSVYVGSENSVDVFSRNTSSGALTFDGCTGDDTGCTATNPATAVVSVRSVAVSADGSSVYAANRAFDAVDVFSRNTSTGALTYKSCIGSSGSECPTTIPTGALDEAESVAVSGDGTSVYAGSNGFPGTGGVVWLSRNTSTGALSYQGCFGAEAGCTATTPTNALADAFSVTVSPDGDNVYAASEGPNAVTGFSRNTSTGALTYEGCIGNDEGCTATSPIDALDDANSVVVSADGSSVYATAGATINQFSRGAIPPSQEFEFGRCLKVTAGTGVYGNAGCTTKGGKKGYEWDPAFGGSSPLAKKHFTSAIKEKTTVTLETVSKTKLTCADQTGSGEYTGNKTISVSLTFTGCEGLAAKCSTSGAAEGEIRMTKLEGTLGVITTSKTGPAKNKMGLDLKPTGSSPFVEFTCGKKTAKIRGSVIAPIAADKMATTTQLKYVSKAGVQKPTHFEGAANDQLEASVAESAYELIGLTLATVQTNEEKVEINSVV